MAEQKHKGVYLKQAREAKGISLQSVHEVTKIPMDALRAIEEGYTVRTLSSFYMRGFTKMYAQYLGIDIHDVVEDYQPEKIPKPVKGDDTETFNEKFRNLISRGKSQMILRIIIVVVAILLLIRIGGCVKRFMVNRPQRIAQREKIARQRADLKKAQQKEQERAAQAQAPATPAREQQPSGKEQTKKVQGIAFDTASDTISLTVRAKKNTWLQVKVDGSIVFQSTFRHGSVETWKAQEKIELAGKDLHELEFELNGQLIGSLGRSRRRASKVIVTQSGLTTE